MDADFLKREADRLLNDVVLNEALGRIRSAALEKLATCDPANLTSIARQQAKVAVCDAMKAELSAMVLSAAERRVVKIV